MCPGKCIWSKGTGIGGLTAFYWELQVEKVMDRSTYLYHFIPSFCRGPAKLWLRQLMAVWKIITWRSAWGQWNQSFFPVPQARLSVSGLYRIKHLQALFPILREAIRQEDIIHRHNKDECCMCCGLGFLQYIFYSVFPASKEVGRVSLGRPAPSSSKLKMTGSLEGLALCSKWAMKSDIKAMKRDEKRALKSSLS